MTNTVKCGMLATLAALALVTGACAPGGEDATAGDAAATADGPARVPAPMRRAALASMRTDLQNLARAQESYHANEFRYSRDMRALDFNSNAQVDVTIVYADGGAWGATATYDRYTDRGCAIFSGPKRNLKTPYGNDVTDEGRIVCDTM